MRFFISSLVIALACVAARAQTDATEFKVPEVAASAAAPEGFVPAGWRLMQTARGDLNGDGLADAVVVAESERVTDAPGDSWELPRLLVIAFAEAGGRLRLSAVSEKVVLCKGCGGVFGDPFESVEVKGGVLVVDHYSGSRDRWSLTDRFRFQSGTWAHVGATQTNTDTLDLSYTEQRDANLSTGLVIESGRKGRRSYRRAFYELRAGRVERAASVDGQLSEGEWPGPTVRVGSKENVVGGASLWRGAEDASARLGAAFSGGDLYVSAEVTDDSVTDGDALRLITQDGRVVRPLEMRKAARPGGYAIEARYALKDLGLEALEARIKELRGYGAGEDDIPADRLLRLSVEIVDADSAQKTPTVLSTSRGGRKYPARVRLTPHPSTPLLEHFDREQSADILDDGEFDED